MSYSLYDLSDNLISPRGLDIYEACHVYYDHWAARYTRPEIGRDLCESAVLEALRCPREYRRGRSLAIDMVETMLALEDPDLGDDGYWPKPSGWSRHGDCIHVCSGDDMYELMISLTDVCNYVDVD